MKGVPERRIAFLHGTIGLITVLVPKGGAAAPSTVLIETMEMRDIVAQLKKMVPALALVLLIRTIAALIMMMMMMMVTTVLLGDWLKRCMISTFLLSEKGIATILFLVSLGMN